MHQFIRSFVYICFAFGLVAQRCGLVLGEADSSQQHEPSVDSETCQADGTCSNDSQSAPTKPAPVFQYDPEYIEANFEVFDIKIIHRKNRTGPEPGNEFPVKVGDLVAGRYYITDNLGSAVFSRVMQAQDLMTDRLVAVKVIKKDKAVNFDQALDEIKVLKFLNSFDPYDEHGIVQLYDYFYYKSHLFIVLELLGYHLEEAQSWNKQYETEPYFINARIQRIAAQLLQSLAFVHSKGLIHADIKPDNVLFKSYSKCQVKLADFASASYTREIRLFTYLQSRSYRAPEAALGLVDYYDAKLDSWSLGCLLAELSSGEVLFKHNNSDTLTDILADVECTVGPIPPWMVKKSRYRHEYDAKRGSSCATPWLNTLKDKLPDADDGLLGFIRYLLIADPLVRPTCREALSHPWLNHRYQESILR